MNERTNERTTKVFRMAAVTVRALFSNTEANNREREFICHKQEEMRLQTSSED